MSDREVTTPETALALDDLIERWHVWNAMDDPDLKVMLGLSLMQDAFDALPNLATPSTPPTLDVTALRVLDEAIARRRALLLLAVLEGSLDLGVLGTAAARAYQRGELNGMVVVRGLIRAALAADTPPSDAPERPA